MERHCAFFQGPFIPRAVSDRRSATADEVFESARNAIRALPAGERFLCFLHLVDVHNDLFNVVKDPLEKNNLLAEELELAAELEQELLEYLKKVEGKIYRSTLSK